MKDRKNIIDNLKVIVFGLQHEEYGVEVHQVTSIERMLHITRVPRTPIFIKGVINLRGVVVPIVDLRRRFGLEEAPYTENSRIIVVSVNGIDVGLIVDSANDVLDIPVNAVEPPPEIVGGVETTYLRGVAKLEKRLLILLNLDKVLTGDELKQIEKIEG